MVWSQIPITDRKMGDGKAVVRMFYGSETLDVSAPTDPTSLPWRWNDGDQVKLSNDAGITHTFTF